MDCLCFVNGICSPHYDEEPTRRPFVENVLKDNLIDNCLSVEGNCALHVKNYKTNIDINFGKNKNSYNATLVNGEVLEEAFERINL